MKNNKSIKTKIICVCCSAGSTIASLGCMAIMGTSIATAGGVALSSMGAMSMNNNTTNFASLFLNSVGLGLLTKVNLRTLEIILIILLLISIFSMYLSFRYHKNYYPLVLLILSSILIYISIFVTMSNILYHISVIGIIVAPIWNFLIKK